MEDFIGSYNANYIYQPHRINERKIIFPAEKELKKADLLTRSAKHLM